MADLVDAKEAAHLLGVTVRTVHRLCDAGELDEAVKGNGVRGPRFFRRRDVQKLAQKRAS